MFPLCSGLRMATTIVAIALNQVTEFQEQPEKRRCRSTLADITIHADVQRLRANFPLLVLHRMKCGELVDTLRNRDSIPELIP